MTQSQRFRLRPRPRGFRWPRPARLERIHLNRRCTKTALCQTDRLTNFRRNGRPRPTPRRNAPREIMRVGHISVQANHLHMIVEASSAEALANGMKSLLSSIARRVNKAFGRRGKLFPNRFHSQAIKSPKQMYNALGYVLKNMMRHGLMLGRTVARSIGKLCLNAVDPYSNANVFRG